MRKIFSAAVWRHLLDETDSIDNIAVTASGSTVLSLSGAGGTLRAWDAQVRIRCSPYAHKTYVLLVYDFHIFFRLSSDGRDALGIAAVPVHAGGRRDGRHDAAACR